MIKKRAAGIPARKDEPEQEMPELVQDNDVRNPPPLSRQVASAWMRTPANDPSEGYDLLVNATFGKDWITLRAGPFHIDTLCSVSSATIEFDFVRCVPIAAEDEGEQEADRITVKEQHSEKTKTTLGGGIDGAASLVSQHGKAHASAKWEKTTNASTSTQRQMVPEPLFYRNGSKSVQIGRLGSELSGPVMTNWKAFRVIPEKGVVSWAAASLKVKERSITFHDIKPIAAPQRWLEPLRVLMTRGEAKSKRAFAILLEHLAQSALANHQDGASATIAHHKLVFKPYEGHPLSVEQGAELRAIDIDEVALEGYLKVGRGHEASALLALGVDPEVVGGIENGDEPRRRSRGEYFIPEGAPPDALKVLNELIEKVVVRPSEIKHRNALRDLRRLKLVVSQRGGDVRLVDARMTNADLLLRHAVAKTECIEIARMVLKLNPLANGRQIAAAVSQDLRLGWNVPATMRRTGNAILRWMLWLEPYVVDAAVSNKAALIAYAVENNKVGKGRPDAYRKAMEKELRSLVAEGRTSAEIAKIFGVSMATVNLWKRHYDLPHTGRGRPRK